MLAHVVIVDGLRPRALLVPKDAFCGDGRPLTASIDSKLDPKACFHDRLRACADALLRGDSKTITLDQVSVVALFDCLRSIFVSIDDATALEQWTGEPLSVITGTRLVPDLAFEDVVRVLAEEAQMLCAERLVFKTRSGQIVFLGYRHGEWTAYDLDNPLLDAMLVHLDQQTVLRALGRAPPK